MDVIILIKWDDAEVKLFSSKEVIYKYLRKKEIKEIKRSVWAKSKEKFEQGEYYSILVRPIIN